MAVPEARFLRLPRDIQAYEPEALVIEQLKPRWRFVEFGEAKFPVAQQLVQGTKAETSEDLRAAPISPSVDRLYFVGQPER
ncbi:MAG: hypothetical protein JWM49_1446 [Microbacteriaceae bacterium]|nr:hypothetical protein [Microbacteriaceae bacterium]